MHAEHIEIGSARPALALIVMVSQQCVNAHGTELPHS